MRILLALLLLLAPPALACGPDSDCVIGDRIYRIAMPEGHDSTTKIPAVIWSHGYRGSAERVMRNGSLRRLLAQQGIALVATQGRNGNWDLPYGPRTFDSDGVEEFAYFDAVIRDITGKHPIDTNRIVASGFSAGGMMVWNLACSNPRGFSGFIPIAGTFWLKPPESCKMPVQSIVHIHGSKDRTVPLTGRAIRETKQGAVADSLEMYQNFGGFGPAERYEAGSLDCRQRHNDKKDVLEFCLFEGGHSFRTEYLAHGIKTLKDAGKF